MTQLTIYIDDDATLRARAGASVAKMSLSGWVTKLIKDHAPQVDANGYPNGFFESIKANAGIWDDFPSQEEIRAHMGQDLPRESM